MAARCPSRRADFTFDIYKEKKQDKKIFKKPLDKNPEM